MHIQKPLINPIDTWFLLFRIQECGIPSVEFIGAVVLWNRLTSIGHASHLAGVDTKLVSEALDLSDKYSSCSTCKSLVSFKAFIGLEIHLSAVPIITI